MIELFKFFLLLGSTGFGGPLSLVQLMREHFVEKQKKMTADEFDQVFTMIKAMPGPVAFQMAVFLGQKFYRFKGALLAGFGLLLPPFVMIVMIAFFYERLIQFTSIKYLLDGFLFSVSAIILLSLKSMILTSYKSILFWLIIFATFALTWFQALPEPFLIIGFGALVALFKNHFFKNQNTFLSVGFLLFDYEKMIPLFKTCLYAGTFVFGTGLAILPVLKGSFVDQYQWLTLQEFNDGVIFGQMTPGPVTITATFLGYRISGFAGALVSSVGIFLMPFIHMTTWFPLAVKWLSQQSWIKSFLVGATAAVIGSILVTLVRMNENSYHQPLFWIIFLATLLVLIKKPKTSLIFIILASGLVHLVVTLTTTYTV